MSKEQEYVVNNNKSIITKKGNMGAGDPVSKDDIRNPENFNVLIEKYRIVKAEDFKKSNDGDLKLYEPPKPPEDKKEDKKKEDKKKDKPKSNNSGNVSAPGRA